MAVRCRPYLSTWLLVVGFGFASLLTVGCTWGAVPSEIKDLVFVKSEFSAPIVLVLPQEDSAELLQQLKTTRFGLAPIIWNKGFDNIDKQLLTYLVKNGFARVETATLQSQYFSGSQHNFLFYEDKLKKFPGVTQVADSSFVVKIGSRVLKSITYTNLYEAAPLGVRVKFYALTFTYTLEGALLGLPPINDTFEGKARAYLDPDDGKWKRDRLNLDDRGNAEYLTSVQKQYTAYIPQTPPPQMEALRSLESRQRATLQVSNLSGETVQVFWIDFSGKEVLYRELKSGESYTQETFVTHPWRVRTKDSKAIKKTITASQARQHLAIER
jgi:hypothetical protein